MDKYLLDGKPLPRIGDWSLEERTRQSPHNFLKESMGRFLRIEKRRYYYFQQGDKQPVRVYPLVRIKRGGSAEINLRTKKPS